MTATAALSFMKRLTIGVALMAVLALGCGRNGTPSPRERPASDADGEGRQDNGHGEAGPKRKGQGVFTGALIALDRSPLASVLEAKLLQSNKATWLDRNAFDQVLREQKLQAMFAPEGSPDRVALGKLLKADLLVLVRTVENRDQQRKKEMELVVCETKRGLRLCVQTIPMTVDAEAAVAAMEQFVEQAIGKMREEITAVCAVPPFVSNDLGYEFDYLKATYSKVIEQILLGHKGTVVVELAEAQAIAREVTLHDAGNSLKRQTPLLFLGEFRNEGKGERRRVSISLNLLRGQTPVATARKPDLVPAEVPSVLRRTTDGLMSKVVAGDRPRFDSDVEANQLATRAQAFANLGNWPEALALIEASLLLEPDQPKLRPRAVVACGKLARQYWLNNMSPKDVQKPSEMLLALDYNRRGLEHLETFLKSGNVPRAYGDRFGRNFVDTFVLDTGMIRAYPPRLQELTGAYAELRQQERETLLRLVRLREGDTGRETLLFLDWAGQGLSKRERYAVVLKLILEWQGLPGTRERTMRLAQGPYALTALDEPEFRELLDQLLAAGNPEVRRAAQGMKIALAAIRLAKEKAKASGPAAPPKVTHDPKEVAFRPLELQAPAAGDGRISRPRFLGGCLPAGKGTDVFLGVGALYLMKEKGRLQTVWTAGELNVHCAGVCYDGRYVWAGIVRHLKPPSLLVLDPVSEKSWEITAKDGLPQADQADLPEKQTWQTLLAAPLAPGKVCVAGFFGRTWLAVVTFDGPGSKHVKVFHEAREAADFHNRGQWRRATVAFQPSYMLTLTDKAGEGDKAARRVLLGRKCSNPEVCWHPLLIDPDTLTVKVMADRLTRDTPANLFDVHQGALYFVEDSSTQRGRVDLARIGFPSLRKETVMKGLPEAWVVFTGDRLNLVGQGWWKGNLRERNVRLAAASVPWDYNFLAASLPNRVLRTVCRSSHYGLVAVVTKLELRRQDLIQVEVLNSPNDHD